MRTVRFLGCICLYNLSRFGGADNLFQWNRNAYLAPINVPKGIRILGAFFSWRRGGGREKVFRILTGILQAFVCFRCE